jgi:ABC-2 type transport system permease protein
MSAAAVPSQVGVSQTRVVRSEWTKLWSLRSTRWSLLVSVVGMAGLGILVSAVQMAHWNQMDPHDRATFNPWTSASAAGTWRSSRSACSACC